MPIHPPPLIGGVLLAYLLLFLPWLSYRSALQLRTMRAGAGAIDGSPAPSLTRIFTGTLVFLVLLFGLSWIAGRAYRYAPFSDQSLGAREIGIGVVALAGFLGLRWLSRAIRSPEERRAMAVRQLMPRTATEWRIYFVVGLAAGIAEEYAYRGVGMYALTQWIGNPWIAALVLSGAFALAHITQEWKSVGIVFLMALLSHALVALTGTVVVAMVVHTGYDWLAAVLLRREMKLEEGRAGPPDLGRG